MAAPMMKMVLQSSGMHREYPLNDFEDALIYIGTTPNCQILLDRAVFQSDFEFLLKREQNEWTLCDGPGAHCWQARHLEAIPVLLGTDVSVRYANRIDEICRIRFLQTARDSWQDFDLRIPLMAEAQRTVYISGTRGGNIWLKDPEAAQEAVELQAVGGSWRLNVPRSLCGVYLNGELVTQPVLLKDMDFFTVYNYTFYYKGSALYTASRLQNDITGLHTQDVSGHTSALQYPVFLRSTRVQYVVNDNEIEVLPPKGMQEEAEDNLWLTLVPALVMLVVVVVLRGFLGGGGTFVIYSVASMVVAMGVSIATRRSKRKQYLKREEQRKARYLSYIQTKVEEIKRRRQEEIVIWNRIYRPMYDNLTTVRNFDKGLFDRSFEDQDFLDVRIGTGQMEAMARIKVSRQEYKETDDDLVDLPLDIEAKYRRLENAPVVAHFRQANGIGVVGKRDRQYELLKIMTMDLCLRHYYKALRLFFIFPQEEKEKFAWARWLHNCRNEDTSLRNLMYDDESIKIHLEQLYRILSTREEEYTEDASGPPVWPCYYVIFAYDCEPIRNHPVSQYFESCSRYGVTFVFFNEHEECIPRGCREIVYVNALDLEGRLIECKNGDLEAPYILTPLENALVDEIVQKLCPVEVV